MSAEDPETPSTTNRWLIAGLFAATLATLLVETLDARLLSVLTWYHLSFFAVSLAMLGMASGAVFVFVQPERFTAGAAPATLARLSLWLALSIPAAHAGNLVVPFLTLNEISVMEVLSVVVSTVILATPFVLSGVVVTVALTRCGGSIGRLYAFDLLGAATGCLLVVPVLEHSNVSSAILLAGGFAAVAAACFHRFAGQSSLRPLALAGVLVLVASLNSSFEVVHVIYPKNRSLWLMNHLNAKAAWNSHSYVLVQQPTVEGPFYWGPGKGVEDVKQQLAWVAIDGEAGTPITRWDGTQAALDWVKYDVTTLPYVLRRGDVAIVGIGGGRDILAALWGGNRSIVGVDVNKIMIDNLTNSHREFAGIANRKEVTLVHDDGRAYLTRAAERFDIIQMSLVDTWASTGAGAFTLSENGLYTREAWRVFLDRLKPGGVLSVSRWFNPRNVSETNRLVALGVAALLDRGVAEPAGQLVLVVSGQVATVLVSSAPFTAADGEEIRRVAGEREFQIVASPWADPTTTRLARILRSRSDRDLQSATYDPSFDYSPPTDRRPYFFNMLKPRAVLQAIDLPRGGVLSGNLRATYTLLLLLAVAAILSAIIIVWPLARVGRPPMPAGRFVMTMTYFVTIGLAYMFVQIALLQRFSVYLGHPTYTLAIVLFAMLLFTGAGSLVSERLARGRAWARAIPVAIGVALALTVFVLPGVLDRTVTGSLPVRTAVVLLFTGPLSVLLGQCFPLGVRLMRRYPSVVPWAWGANGAAGVLASILAVCVSIWLAIDANLWLAAGLYFFLTVPLAVMSRAAVGDEGSDLGV